jgi:acetolactate synthase-1/2/3 large subunit
MLFGIHHLRINEPNTFFLSLGLGSMGSGIGAALGIKLAAPERPVVAICGDGCFSMGLAELATAARERLPFLTVVLNDERFGMVEIGHEALYGTKPRYSAGPLSVPLLARGAGAQAFVIERPGDLLHLDVSRALRAGPVVLDVHIDRGVRMPHNARNEFLAKSAARSQMRAVS